MFMRTTRPAERVPIESVIFREGEASFHTLVEHLASAVLVSRGGRLHYVNRAAQAITGYTREELLTMNFLDLLTPNGREPIELESQDMVRIRTKDDRECWLDITATPIDFDNEPSTLISAFDLTERKRAEEHAQLLAITDPLTGLGNYRRLLDVLHAEIERSGRTGRSFAVLLLDLDGLKKINDHHGHLAGSQALCRLGNVLRLSCRAIDTAARYGGDEFAVVLPETTFGAAEFVALRIRERLEADMEQPAIAASIGVAVYPGDGQTIEALLQTADRALYEMKSCTAKRSPVLVAV